MKKERKHIRLSDWDYSSSGIYFITICCHNRQPFLGRIIKNEINYSKIGLIALQYWLAIPEHFPDVKLDELIIMPNHIHGILILNNRSAVGTRHGVSRLNRNQFAKPIKNSVSVIINQYKSSVKRWCNKNGFNDFKWQSRFYDRIVHNENSIDRIREYIRNNPNNWKEDDLNNSLSI